MSSPATEPARLTTAEAEARAREVYADYAARGVKLTGNVLAREVGDRSERWGRDTLKALNTEHGDAAVVPLRAAPPPPPATPAPDRQPPTPRRTPTPTAGGVHPAVLRIALAGAALVAAVGFAMSFDHMQRLAAATGQGRMSYLLPLSVDGLMIVASMVMLWHRRRAEPVGFLAWTALAAGVVASVGANIAAAELDHVSIWVARAVNAWPPLALLIAFDLVLQLIRTKPPKKGPKR